MKPTLKTSSKVFVAPSLLSCDFSRVREEVGEVERGGCDILHIDIMDGHFVPNLTIGPVVVAWVRKCTKLPLDVHLMIDEPIRHLEAFRKAGADAITVHVEACQDVAKTLGEIKRLGAEVGISLRPKTPVEKIFPFLDGLDLVLVMTVEPGFGGQKFMPEMLEKVKNLRSRFKGKISVDGGIDPETAPRAIEAGANVLVAGTAIFGQRDRAKAIENLRKSR
ncbi:MAG: ribulose-phosphate 3-epimerase [Candidatus Omnitrophica bacterium]|nr:ribulose-phosphate 3-epimerase [Candidatus Omnitrophota bacterium]